MSSGAIGRSIRRMFRRSPCHRVRPSNYRQLLSHVFRLTFSQSIWHSSCLGFAAGSCSWLLASCGWDWSILPAPTPATATAAAYCLLLAGCCLLSGSVAAGCWLVAACCLQSAVSCLLLPALLLLIVAKACYMVGTHHLHWFAGCRKLHSFVHWVATARRALPNHLVPSFCLPMGNNGSKAARVVQQDYVWQCDGHHS